jgi:hypothetical protein
MSSEDPIIGYKYFIGFHLIPCLSGVRALRKIATDKKLLWNGNVTTNQTISINKPDLFGGDPPAGSGGMAGYVDVMFGESDQPVNEYTGNILNKGKIVPAYRGVMGFVFKRFYVGNSATIKPIKFLLEGDPMGSWRSDIKFIKQDDVDYDEINPVHYVRHLIASKRDGMSFSESYINDASFDAAAQTIYDEGFGLSIKWTKIKSYSNIFNEIKKHIAAEIYQNPYTGLWEITLIRDDYDTATMVSIGKSNSRLNMFKKESSSGACNDMTINYNDLSRDRTRSVNQKNPALIDINGGQTVAITNDYPFINSESLARTVCARDARQSATALASIELEITNGAGEGMLKGETFKFTRESEGCVDPVFRVIDINNGSPDNPMVKIKAVEDIFSYGFVTENGNNDNGWDPVVTDPEPITIRSVMEMPYPLAARKIPEISSVEAPAALMVAAARPTQTDIKYTMLTDFNDAGSYKSSGSGSFTPWGLINGAILIEDDQLLYSSSADLDLISLPAMALINRELIEISAIDLVGDMMTINRGCGDSIPEMHASGSYIWVISKSVGSIIDDIAPGDDIDIKLNSINANGSISDIETLPTDSVAVTSNLSLPYPPANIMLNGENWPSSLTGDIVVTWNIRDRYMQQDRLTGYYEAADIGGGDIVRIEAYDGITQFANYDASAADKTFTLTPPASAASVRVKIYSIENDVESVNYYEVTMQWSSS